MTFSQDVFDGEVLATGFTEWGFVIRHEISMGKSCGFFFSIEVGIIPSEGC